MSPSAPTGQPGRPEMVMYENVAFPGFAAGSGHIDGGLPNEHGSSDGRGTAPARRSADQLHLCLRRTSHRYARTHGTTTA